MLKQHAQTISVITWLVDLFITGCSFYIAYLIRPFIPVESSDFNYIFSDISFLLLPIGIIWSVIFAYDKVYESQRFHSVGEQTRQIIEDVIICILFLFAAITFFKTANPGRIFLLLFSFINILLLCTARLSVTTVRHFIRQKGFNIRHVVIVGIQEECRVMLDKIRKNPGWGLSVEGIIKPSPRMAREIAEIEGVPVLGSLADFREILQQRVIDFVFFAVQPDYLYKIQPYVAYCIQRGITVKVSVNFFSRLNFVKFHMDEMNGIPLVSFETTSRKPIQQFVKETLDRAVAAAGLILLSPVFLAIAVAIKIESSGPVFFRQTRVGRNGRHFAMYKFRSMVVDAEKRLEELRRNNEMSGPVFKMTSDPRVTKTGRFLRKTSLDELPQLINVFKGEMSLVGPRPPIPTEVKQYDNWQIRRLSVKPGITCIWQVSGRNNIDFDQWMEMDLHYIDNWSLWNDFKLLFKTLPAVIFQKGAK